MAQWRFFVDENSLAVAKALACVRDDVTDPGAPGGLVAQGTKDPALLPVIGQYGLVLLTRDKNIRLAPAERRLLLERNVRACFLTSGGNLNRFEQLRLWLRHWDAIERLIAAVPAPWLASVTKNEVRLFDTKAPPR